MIFIPHACNGNNLYEKEDANFGEALNQDQTNTLIFGCEKRLRRKMKSLQRTHGLETRLRVH